jgi:hypothetical protein
MSDLVERGRNKKEDTNHLLIVEFQVDTIFSVNEQISKCMLHDDAYTTILLFI